MTSITCRPTFFLEFTLVENKAGSTVRHETFWAKSTVRNLIIERRPLRHVRNQDLYHFCRVSMKYSKLYRVLHIVQKKKRGPHPFPRPVFQVYNYRHRRIQDFVGGKAPLAPPWIRAWLLCCRKLFSHTNSYLWGFGGEGGPRPPWPPPPPGSAPDRSPTASLRGGPI